MGIYLLRDLAYRKRRVRFPQNVEYKILDAYRPTQPKTTLMLNIND